MIFVGFGAPIGLFAESKKLQPRLESWLSLVQFDVAIPRLFSWLAAATKMSNFKKKGIS